MNLRQTMWCPKCVMPMDYYKDDPGLSECPKCGKEATDRSELDREETRKARERYGRGR